MTLLSPSRIVGLFVVATGLVYGLAYFNLYAGKGLFTRDAIIWYGSFHYYVESIISGHFPYWDPYMMTGTYFYPTISLLGLLDPAVLVSALLVKLTSLSPLTVYIYFHTFRLLLCAVGAYYLFDHITGSRTGAALAACIFFLALSAAYCVTDGPVLPIFLTPFALYFLLKFLDEINTTKRYLFLSAFALVTGITMNVYIPAYYLFNLFGFLVVLFAFRIVRIGDVARAFRDKKLVWCAVAAALAVVLMTAPPLAVMTKDAAPGGELFPMVRIIQKNDGKFKKIMATQINTEAVSSRFTNQQGVFSSYGNMLSLVFPDIFESVPFFADDLLAEIPHYIGIIPFLLALIGFLYYKSRYRYLAVAMMLLITINMFSFYGMSGKPFNALQQVFNTIFPPLKMIEVRELFGPFFLLYLCMLLSMGFSILFDAGKFRQIAQRGYRMVIILCIAVVALKAAITGYFAGKVIVASANDLLVVVQVALFAVCIYLFARGHLGRGLLYSIMVLLIFFDQYVYAAFNARYTVGESGLYHQMVDAGRMNSGIAGFEYFRDPLSSPPGVGFGESILRRKGVLTYGNNHSIFTTKRYYDLLTHLPLQNQLALSGVIFPVVRFFPVENVMRADDRKQEFDYLMGAGDRELTESLVVEQEGPRASAGTHELGALQQYEDVAWLQPASLLFSVDSYLRGHAALLDATRKNEGALLHTPEYSLGVRAFSPNEIVIQAHVTRDGFLLYNDGWSKYWEAYDNGHKIPVYIANYNSKAVFLPAGEHTVRFVFNPVHYKIALVAYYAGLMMSLGMIGCFYLRSRKEVRQPQTADDSLIARHSEEESRTRPD